MSTTNCSRTYLAFHHDAKLRTLKTTVTEIKPISALTEADRGLFKAARPADDFVVITPETIFHPQGGGQPSDEGTMTTIPSAATTNTTTFTVTSVRMSVSTPGQVLHLGSFPPPSPSSSSPTSPTSPPPPLTPGTPITQSIDPTKRLLYSRLHTAGHVLGAAVRHLCESQIPHFDELKASHFPDAAACEFQGLISGDWKAPIQDKVDEYIARAMPVEIEWWDDEDFRREGLERLIAPKGDVNAGGAGGDDGSQKKVPSKEKLRVVRIRGAEVYPCGGTHVDSTDLCGKTTVRKIGRSKGNSKVSYTIS